jgi:hypothetical protein
VTAVAPLLGVLAALVAVSDTIPYVRDIARGVTRPHRGTWLIWGMLGVVVFLSQRADGASWSLVMAGTQAALMSLIFALSIRRGVGGVSPVELVMIGVAAGGIAGWLIVDEPVVATACVVVADLIGVALMVPKTWRDPGSETLSTFVLASVSGALAAASVAVLDVALLLYPVYFCVCNGSVALLILHRRAGLAVLRRAPLVPVAK